MNEQKPDVTPQTQQTPSAPKLGAGQPRPQGQPGNNRGPSRGGRGGGRGGFRGGRGGGGRDRGRFDKRPPGKMQHIKSSVPSVFIPEPGDKVRIVPLGGVEEVGKNMIVIEYKNDIVISDAGFQFEEESTPGIDYILPNTRYLEERKHKIRGLFITHGHLDHIGAIPYIMEKLGNPPIYTRHVTALMIKKRQEEFPHNATLDIREVKAGETVQAGELPVRVFGVTHSIPDSMGLCIKTPYGNVVITGDLKLDHTNGEPSEDEKATWGEIGKEKTLLFIADSTNAENPGFSIPHHEILKNIHEIIKNVPGRLIIGTFASQFERLIAIIEMAEQLGKKVITEGRSIKSNIEIAEKAGLLKFQKGTLIPSEEIDRHPANKIVVIATGAQGEEFAALMRMSNKTHKNIRLNKTDTVMLSSSVIPGNEVAVQKLKDNLYHHDLRIIHFKTSDIHSSGHGNQQELAWFNLQVKPRFFMPAYGYHSMLRVHAHTIRDFNKFPEENIIVPESNGSVIELGPEGESYTIRKEKAPSNVVMVDGLSVGDMQEVVLRDRQMLSEDGIFIVIATIDTTTGKLRKSPDLISRGFVYLRESQELLHDARYLVKKTVEEAIAGMHPINVEFVKDKVTDSVERYLLQKTAKRPIVITTVLAV